MVKILSLTKPINFIVQVAKITVRLSFIFFSLDAKNCDTYMTPNRPGGMTWHTARCAELKTKVSFFYFFFCCVVFFVFVVDVDSTSYIYATKGRGTVKSSIHFFEP